MYRYVCVYVAVASPVRFGLGIDDRILGGMGGCVSPILLGFSQTRRRSAIFVQFLSRSRSLSVTRRFDCQRFSTRPRGEAGSPLASFVVGIPGFTT